MHLNVTGPAPSTYTIAAGTTAARRDRRPGRDVLGPPTATLLNPATFVPAKLGMAGQDIQFTPGGGRLGVNGVFGHARRAGDYTNAPHLGSTRCGEDRRHRSS